MQFVLGFVERHGLQMLSCRRLREVLRVKVFGNRHTPSKKLLSGVFRHVLKLRYARFESKGALLGVPELSNRRLWVSRLVTNFLAEGALVISVDEAALQLDMHNRKQWTCTAAAGEKPTKQKASKTLNLAKRTTSADLTRLRTQKVPNKQPNMTLLSAVTSEGHVANQIIEGAADSVLFANFLDGLLRQLGEALHRDERSWRERPFIVLMDNASIHRGVLVRAVLRWHWTDCLFNCPYSPQLNPIETYFSLLKRRVRSHELTTRISMVRTAVEEIQKLSATDRAYPFETMMENW